VTNPLSDQVEYVIDGNAVNKLIQGYDLKSRMLPGQVFEIVEKKLVPSLADEIDKAKPQLVRFENLEAISNGPYADFAYAICGGLAELADSLVGKGIGLVGKGIGLVGTINDPRVLPWNIFYRISKGLKASKPMH
jgi:hypothetical protein